MKLFKGIPRLFSGFFRRFSRRWKLVTVDGDSLPPVIPEKTLVLARDGDEEWCVGMRCPCGCGKRIELLLIPEASPRWKLNVDAEGHPSLSPSVWLKSDCRSHFWLRSGRVVWCQNRVSDLDYSAESSNPIKKK